MCRNIRTLHNFEPPATEAEFFALLDPINDEGKTLEDAAKAVRTSQAYADRVIP